MRVWASLRLVCERVGYRFGVSPFSVASLHLTPTSLSTRYKLQPHIRSKQVDNQQENGEQKGKNTNSLSSLDRKNSMKRENSAI